jgi:DNA-binding NarL/FixJ family response regulator
MIREHVRSLLASEPELQVTAEVGDGLALLQLMEYSRRCPDLVILDITMPRMHGIEAARRIKAQHPETKIIILTIHKEREYLEEALAAGAEGYVLKDVMDYELTDAVSDVLAGRRYVSGHFRGDPGGAR